MKIFRMTFLALAALILAACAPSQDPTPPKTLAEQVADAAAVSPSQLTDSGATVVPTSLDEVVTSVMVVGMTEASPDSQTSQVIGDVGQLANGVRALTNRAVATTAEQIQKQLEDAQAALLAGQKATIDIDLSGNDLGQYIGITQAKAQGSAQFTLAAGAEQPGADLENVRGLHGQGLVQIALTTQDLPEGSFKEVLVRLGAGGTIDASTDGQGHDTLAADLKVAASVAISASALGPVNGSDELALYGGKFVVTADGRLNRSFSSADTEDLEGALLAATELQFSLSVYDDADTLKFTKTYTSLEALQADLEAYLNPQAPQVE